jgi:glucose-6-phosphate dehydrogenase assembly protein OpcA
MIIHLPNTSTADIAKTLITARDEGGQVALGRVLTCIIATRDTSEESVIQAANDASREHPMRLIVVSHPVTAPDSQPDGLDAEIRLGGDAGASEVLVLRPRGESAHHIPGLINGLLLPDAPVVTWWPEDCPPCMGDTPLGQMSQRRIMDSQSDPHPLRALQGQARGYRPGDTDLAWARITGWRSHLAATLDALGEVSITEVAVAGHPDNPSVTLLAAWLAYCVGITITVTTDIPEGITGVFQVGLRMATGAVTLTRVDDNTATLTQPGQPDFPIFLPRRGLPQLLAEELRRLVPDPVFGKVLTDGLPRVSGISSSGEKRRP